MFTENNTVKYIVSLISDLSNLYTDYKANKVSWPDACAKHEELKNYYKMLVMRGDMWPDIYKAYFVDYPTFEDFFTYMEANMGEA